MVEVVRKDLDSVAEGILAFGMVCQRADSISAVEQNLCGIFAGVAESSGDNHRVCHFESPLAATQVTQAEWPGLRQAFLDLLRGEASWREQVRRKRIARRKCFHDAFGQNPQLRERQQRDFHNVLGHPRDDFLNCEWCRHVQRIPLDDIPHTPHRFAQSDFLRSGNAHGLIREPRVFERCTNRHYEIPDGEWTHRFFSHAHKSENWKCVQRVAEMVEHVVAVAVNHPRLEDRAVEAGRSDGFFSRPFRFVVCGATIWAGAQEAQKNNLAHAGLPRGLNYILSSFHVYATVGLWANLAIDACAVRDRLASGKRSPQLLRIGQIRSEETRSSQFVNGFVAQVFAARNQYHLMASRHKLARQVPPHEAGSTRNRDSHLESPMPVTTFFAAMSSQ